MAMGKGELLTDPKKFHDDCRLIGVAIKKRWPISDEVKGEILARLISVVANSPDDETAIKAINQLRQMEQANQKDEQAQLSHSDRNRFFDIATRLGLAKTAERIAESGGESNTMDAG